MSEKLPKMRDSEIEQWVLNEIRLRTNGRLKELCVCSINGVVSLKGTVLSRVDKLAVQAAAERAKGCELVVDQLKLQTRSRPGHHAKMKKQGWCLNLSLR